MLKPNIHILGIQGSGKGTQVTRLQELTGLTPLQTGNLFRRRAQRDDEFGRRLAGELRTGDLLSDQDLFTIVSDFFSQTPVPKGILADGAIRHSSQFQIYEPLWERYDLDEPYLVYLDLDDETAQKRIYSRGIQDDIPREDNTPQAIEKRISLFHSKTKPVITQFEQNHRMITVDASQNIEAVTGEIISHIQQIYPSLFTWPS